MCELYGPWIQWLFVAIKGGHYRIDIISGVGHSMSDLVVLLMLCMTTCNGWDIDIIVQIPRDSANLAENW